MSKKLLITLSIVLLMVILTFFVENSDDTTASDSKIGETIGEIYSDDIDEIVISNDNENIKIVQKDSRWILEKYNYLASSTIVFDLLDRINKEKIADLISTNKSNFSKLGFKDDGNSAKKKVELLKGGETKLSFLLGENRSKGGQYLKYVGEDKVYLIHEAYNPPLNAANTLDKKLPKIDQEKISEIMIAMSNESFALKPIKGEEGKISYHLLINDKTADANDQAKKLFESIAHINFSQISELNQLENINQKKYTELTIHNIDNNQLSIKVFETTADEDTKIYWLSLSGDDFLRSMNYDPSWFQNNLFKINSSIADNILKNKNTYLKK